MSRPLPRAYTIPEPIRGLSINALLVECMSRMREPQALEGVGSDLLCEILALCLFELDKRGQN